MVTRVRNSLCLHLTKSISKAYCLLRGTISPLSSPLTYVGQHILNGLQSDILLTSVNRFVSLSPLTYQRDYVAPYNHFAYKTPWKESHLLPCHQNNPTTLRPTIYTLGTAYCDYLCTVSCLVILWPPHFSCGPSRLM